MTAPEADSFTLASLEPTAKALDGAAALPLLCCRPLPLTTAFAHPGWLAVVVAEFKVPSMLEVANTDATQLRAELGIPKQTTKLLPPVAIPRGKGRPNEAEKKRQSE